MSNKYDIYRRRAVSFDAHYFEKQKNRGEIYSLEKAFYHINSVNLWGSLESASGEGSTFSETKQLKRNLQKILQDLQVKTILDAGCGDFSWMRKLDLTGIQYYGIDVLKDTIRDLRCAFKDDEQLKFIIGNISQVNLPKTDLIICRDCLVHFSFYDINKVLFNFKKSDAKYLLTTTFTEATSNEDIVTGDWQTLNLQLRPFDFPKPLLIVKEGCMQNNGLYEDKSLALWELKNIKSVINV